MLPRKQTKDKEILRDIKAFEKSLLKEKIQQSMDQIEERYSEDLELALTQSKDI